MKLRVAVVSAFYSEGMGYTENCLPKFLAAMGHDVHVFTSAYNVYGNEPDYSRIYESFLGPAVQPVGTYRSSGYTVHRLPSRLLSGYVWLPTLWRTMAKVRPDVVHSLEHGSLLTFCVAALRPLLGFSLFTESHQHLSVVKPYLREPGHILKKAGYWLTRTLPGWTAARAVDRCFAIAPDCAEVARRYFGVPASKITMQSLGADTQLFRPPLSADDAAERTTKRAALGYGNDDIVCVYTGRFSAAKNPALLAEALAELVREGKPVRGLFVGEGPQRSDIERHPHCQILPFMRHRDLAEVYRAADIAVWPREESMSMIDAAASGLPLIGSDRLGESERLEGSGYAYRENDASSLADAIRVLCDPVLRAQLGERGVSKMRQSFNWEKVAASVSDIYERTRLLRTEKATR